MLNLIWTLFIFQCLLTDEEMELGPEKWEETMGDSIKLFLESDAEEFEDSEGSDDDDEDEEGNDNEDNEDQDEVHCTFL